MFKVGTRPNLVALFRGLFPILRFIVSRGERAPFVVSYRYLSQRTAMLKGKGQAK